MNFQRLDNRRLPGDFTEVEAPTVTVTKSYAKLSPSAAQVLGVQAGDFLAFHMSENGDYAFSKAADEKGGKKVSENLTLVSASIYKRLKEGATYVIGAPVNAVGINYFPLAETTTEAPVEAEAPVTEADKAEAFDVAATPYSATGDDFI